MAWLTPGFINAHCHLEYSWLRDCLPRGPIPFGEWMRAIMSRRATTADEMQQRNDSMQRAAEELIKGGCTTVIDSTTDGNSEMYLKNAGIRHFLFHEVLGLTTDRAQTIFDEAMKRCDASKNGMNPHAPYSVGPWLRERLRGLPATLPIAWHLAETPDEEALFIQGEGSIARVLKDFGLPLPYEELPRSSSLEFLNNEGLLDSCDLAFHGNEMLESEVINFRAPRGLVHCPSTHAWFRRPAVPLAHWLNKDVNVCLGTDSLASSETLSMLEILRLAATTNPSLTPDQLLTMICHNPAKLPFLANMKLTGTFAPGSPADLVSIKSAEGSDSWYEVISSDETVIDKVMIGGHTVY